MEIVLINPASSIALSDKTFRRFLTPLPPQGIAYVGALLEKNRLHVTLIDQHGEGLSNSDLIKRICKISPRIIGFSCLTPVMGNVKMLIDKIREVNNKIFIVLGNIHPTIFADDILKTGMADAIVRGEGEVSMLELALAIKQERDLSEIKGISFRNNGSIFHNPDREPIKDLDSLPYPAWHLLDLNCYREIPLASLYNIITLPMQASRGCSYKCIFCAQEAIYKGTRFRKVVNVANEIEYMYNKLKARAFGFNDASFPFSDKSGFEFCEKLIKKGLHKKIKWGTELRVDCTSEKLLKKMKEAGAHLIMYGFEVGDQEILRKSGKNATLEQAYRAMRYTKEAGIMTLGLFMLGLPGETKETCNETIEFAKKLDCDFVKFNVTIPYPGTILYQRYKRDIEKKFFSPEKFTSWYDWSNSQTDLIYTPEGMTSSELVHLQRKAMFGFYVRPKIIIRHLFNRTVSLKNLFFGAYILITRFFKSFLRRRNKK